MLKLGGQIHFKTDNANLFAWSLPEMESCFLELRNVTDDLHANGPVGIMTGYEENSTRSARPSTVLRPSSRPSSPARQRKSRTRRMQRNNPLMQRKFPKLETL